MWLIPGRASCHKTLLQYSSLTLLEKNVTRRKANPIVKRTINRRYISVIVSVTTYIFIHIKLEPCQYLVALINYQFIRIGKLKYNDLIIIYKHKSGKFKRMILPISYLYYDAFKIHKFLQINILYLDIMVVSNLQQEIRRPSSWLSFVHPCQWELKINNKKGLMEHKTGIP